MLVDKYLAWQASERPNKQLKESDADTSIQPMDGNRPVGELRRSWKKLRRRRVTPWEDQQSQLTWTLKISQKLSHQPDSIHWLVRDP